MSEKPLEVRAAEIMGCEPELRQDGWHCSCEDRNHNRYRPVRDDPLKFGVGVTTDQMIEFCLERGSRVYFSKPPSCYGKRVCWIDSDVPAVQGLHDAHHHQALLKAFVERFKE